MKATANRTRRRPRPRIWGVESSTGLIFQTKRSTNTTRSVEQRNYRGRGRRRERGRLAVARSRTRCRRRTRSSNRQRHHLLQITPMKGIANDCTGHQEEANQKNGADTVGKTVPVLRAVFF